MSDARLFSAAAARNREPILDVLREILSQQGLALKVASGSVEHIVHVAAALTRLTFARSDPSPKSRESIAAWITTSGLDNVQAPIALDAARSGPSSGRTPPFENAGAFPAGTPLYLYGPYERCGAHTAPSNAEFDAGLRAQNSAWGVRDLEAVADLGAQAGFSAPEMIEMPANNLSLIFRRCARTTGSIE
jgi:hypothetical protein